MKLRFKVVRKLCLGIFAIYSINILFNSVGVSLPINLYSIFMSSFFGFSGIVTMILLVILI